MEGFVQEVAYDVGAPNQRPRGTFLQPREQNNEKQIENVLVYVYLSCFLVCLSNEVLSKNANYWEGGGEAMVSTLFRLSVWELSSPTSEMFTEISMCREPVTYRGKLCVSTKHLYRSFQNERTV